MAPAPGNASCTVRSDNPHGSKGTPGQMVGKTRYGCDQTIDSITVYVQIEQNVGGVWTVLARNGDGQTTPNPAAGATYTAQASSPCRSGEFRTASRGSGYYGGRPSGSMAWHYSQAVKDPCS